MYKLMHEDSACWHIAVEVDVDTAVVYAHTTIATVWVVYKVDWHANTLAKVLYVPLYLAESFTANLFQLVKGSLKLCLGFQCFFGERISSKRKSTHITRVLILM